MGYVSTQTQMQVVILMENDYITAKKATDQCLQVMNSHTSMRARLVLHLFRPPGQNKSKIHVRILLTVAYTASTTYTCSAYFCISWQIEKRATQNTDST